MGYQFTWTSIYITFLALLKICTYLWNAFKLPTNFSNVFRAQAVQDWPTNFIFSFIVSSSANFLLFQAEGQTILHIASLNGDENMIRTLYLARANATIQDNEGK